MKNSLLILLFSLLLCSNALAQDFSVDIKILKDLTLKTQTVEQASYFNGKAMMARVSVLPGQAYTFKSPIDVQQVQYLKGNGASVKKHERYVIIKGPEVHHFYMAYKMKKVIAEQAQAYFNNSKLLYARKSISEQAWLDISNAYHNTKMEFDELTHFFDSVLSFDEKNDALTLGAPIEGILQYNRSTALNMDDIIASFVPLQAIRLKVNLPINITTKPSGLSHDNCQLTIDFTESTDTAFYQTAWTQALNSQCNFAIGQVISTVPIYQANVYKVKKTSVFNLEGENYIFVLNNNHYQAIKVMLVTSEGANYILQSQSSLDNKSVLTSSVSAVQGILQGLGS